MDVDVNQLDEKASAVAALGVLCMKSPKCAATRLPEILHTLENLQ
jgi:hypothetical protein